MIELTVTTSSREESIDITGQVREAVRRTGVESGLCTVFCPHTTAGLTINERADPAVADDIRRALDDLVPDDRAWAHAEGNAPAHVKASIVGGSTQVLIRDGDVALGRWQGIFLCEFDGPRQRTMWLHVSS
jgi:secondary thiamine-phosphate synthase enzyme